MYMCVHLPRTIMRFCVVSFNTGILWKVAKFLINLTNRRISVILLSRFWFLSFSGS